METKENKEPTIDNRLELLKYTSEVQSRIQKDITSDFILARLGEKDKEAIVELTSDAYFTKRVINEIIKRSHEWNWNKKEKKWYKTPMKEEDAKKIIEIANKTFDAYMIKITMTALLNRNVNQNYLINILAQQQEQQEEETEKVTLAQKPKQLIMNEEQIRQ